MLSRSSVQPDQFICGFGYIYIFIQRTRELCCCVIPRRQSRFVCFCFTLLGKPSSPRLLARGVARQAWAQHKAVPRKSCLLTSYTLPGLRQVQDLVVTKAALGRLTQGTDEANVRVPPCSKIPFFTTALTVTFFRYLSCNPVPFLILPDSVNLSLGRLL